jgi:citrate lyase beta subunit
MQVRRAFLYVPGDDRHKIEKSLTLGVDSICLDLEDGVALNRKEVARQVVAETLQQADFGSSEKVVRINPVASNFYDDDLQVVVPAAPQAIVLPKLEQAEQIRRVSMRITELEQVYGRPAGKIQLLAIIETALGIINLKEICTADPRLCALIFGAEDLVGDLGGVRTPEGWEIFYARSAVVTHAAAFGLQAIDMVYVAFHDEWGLIAETRQGLQMGYTGKQIIHPRQVQPVQRVFTPDEDQIRAASALLKLFAEHQEAGIGAFAFEGKMIDAPMIRAAEQVLARARAAGKLD